MCNRNKQLAVSNRLRGMEGGGVVRGLIEVEFEGVHYEVDYCPEDGVMSIGLAPESKDVDLVDIMNCRLYFAIARKVEQG